MEYGPCDLCAEVGIEKPAIADVRIPGGMWANVCEAHRYRVKSASRAARKTRKVT